jgi:hypothetical protein
MLHPSLLRQMLAGAGGFCAKPWFDPESPHDLKLVFRRRPAWPLEVDCLPGLEAIRGPEYVDASRFVVFQNWGEWTTVGDGSQARPYMALTVEKAEQVGRLVAGGRTRELVLIVTMFMRGALRRLADVVGPRQLERLGCFWFLSGDDMTDESENADDVAYAVQRLGLTHLSILTGAFDKGCEDRMVEGLRGNRTLKLLKVFRKDDAHTWPEVPLPRMDNVLRARWGAWRYWTHEHLGFFPG